MKQLGYMNLLGFSSIYQFLSDAFCLVAPFQNFLDHPHNVFIDTILDLRLVTSPNESRFHHQSEA